VGAVGGVAYELFLLEQYLARNLFSWMRADYRTEAGGKVTAFQDKVALESEGAVAPNARSVDPNHAFAQASGPNQSPAAAASALFNNQVVITNPSESLFYKSTIASSNWKYHSHSHAIYTAARTTAGIACVIHSTANELPTNHGIYYPLRQSAGISTNTATGRILNGTATYHANNNGDVGSAPLNTARVYAWKYTLNTDLAILSAIPKTVAVTGTASSSNPTGGPMALLGDSAFGGVGLIGDWADTLFFNRAVTVAEDALILRYFFLRYGFVA